MALAQGLVQDIEATRRFFLKTLSAFSEEDSGFAPSEELYTVAGHVAHAADTVEWFLDGGFGKGWNMDFDAQIAEAKKVTSLSDAVTWLDRAFNRAVEVIGAASDQELFEPIPDTRIMEGAPRIAIISGIVDHTAHHRGSLAVYARLLGKVPPMPYS